LTVLKILGYVIFFLVISFIIIVFIGAHMSLKAAEKWRRSHQPPGKCVDVNGRKVYVTVKGNRRPAVVIETGLGSFSPEWWHIQNDLARTVKTVTFDRSGYGWSTVGPFPRTPRQEALELKALLENLRIKGPYILVGHSLGGIYIDQFSRMYPGEVAGAVFIDPMPQDFDAFSRELKSKVLRQSGLDESGSIKLLGKLAHLGILRLLKPYMKNSPPFCYYNRIPEKTVDILWNHFNLAQGYKTQLDELEQVHTKTAQQGLKEAGGFPSVPIKVLYHDPQMMIDNMTRYAGLQVEIARKIEELTQEQTRAYLRLSPSSSWHVADKSGHNIHLDKPELVVKTILDVVSEIRSNY